MSRARVNDIIAIASRLSGIAVADIKSDRRYQAIVRVRQAIYYVARDNGHSYPHIGAVLNRDHSSVIHGRDQCANIASRDPEYDIFVRTLAHRASTVLPFEFEKTERKKVTYEFAQVPESKPHVLRRGQRPRNNFTAKPGDKDNGHRFHDGMKAGSDMLLAALLRAETTSLIERDERKATRGAGEAA